jgi:hypothetical protein
MNPKKLGGLANHRQEPWKAPLPEFIESLYRERFGRERPEQRPLDRNAGARRGPKKAERRTAREAGGSTGFERGIYTLGSSGRRSVLRRDGRALGILRV